MRVNRFAQVSLLGAATLSFTALPAFSQAQIFNSGSPANNVTTRNNWLLAISLAVPANLVDFETGFVNNQNIDDIGGLFPEGLVLRDSSGANQVIMRTGVGSIAGSNPVGAFAATHNDDPNFILDFSSSPVDYLAFQDIDHSAINAVITFVGGATQNFSLETTNAGGNSAEFVGIWNNDQPKIVSVAMDGAGGDLRWGIDNIEYGAFPTVTGAPEPGTAGLILAALGMSGLICRRASRKK